MARAELAEPFERMIADLFPPERVRAIERGDSWASEHREIERSGFIDLLKPENDGGMALALTDAVPLFAIVGRHAAPIEIGETMIERANVGPATAASMTAVLLAAAIGGAAQRVAEMSIAYANERVQFGKPIGRQQAVQQQLAVMAQDCIAVRLAAELAADEFPAAPHVKAAVAKSVASEVAARVAGTAHAVHGAIGMSAAHDLQLYTRRLHSWRLRSGSETHWNTALGAEVLASGMSAVDWVRSSLFLEDGAP